MTDPLVLAYLYPAAVATIDYAVSAGQISRWNAAKLGAPPTDQQLADAVASIGYQAWLLAAYKAVKVAAIRANSVVLNAAGFTYGSQTFSVDDMVQLRLNSLLQKKAKAQYPVKTLDKNGVPLSLASSADVDAFTDAAFGRGFAVAIGENALIAAVMAATTQAAVDAVTDTRT